MMEKNNDNFLAGGDAVVYLTETMHRKYATAFARDHPFSMYVSFDQFFDPVPLVRIWTHLE